MSATDTLFRAVKTATLSDCRAYRYDLTRKWDFVLRHTMPERAKAHGHDAVHSIIAHHPFAKKSLPQTPQKK